MRGGFLLVFGFMALVLRFGGLGCLAGLLGSGTVHSKLVLLQYRSGVRLKRRRRASAWLYGGNLGRVVIVGARRPSAASIDQR